MATLAAGVIFWILRKHKAETDGLNSMIEADKGQIAYHVNKEREAIASSSQARVSLQEYKQAHPEEVSAILKQFAIKQNQLEFYLKASFRAENKGVSVVHTTFRPDTTTMAQGDSIEEASFDIGDGYLSLHGDTKTQPGLPWLKVDWVYSYVDTLSFVGRKQKNGFLGLGKETYWVDGKIENPKAQMTSLRNVQITEFKDKRFSVGPGVMLDPFSMKVVVGIGIQYSIFRF